MSLHLFHQAHDVALAWRLVLPLCDAESLCALQQTCRALYVYILKQQLLGKALEKKSIRCVECGFSLGTCWCRTRNLLKRDESLTYGWAALHSGK